LFPTALIQDGVHRRWLAFDTPHHIIEVWRLSEVIAAVEEVARRVDTEGCWAVGFVAYEAAPAFDAVLVTKPPAATPLLWFGLFEVPRLLDELPWAQAVDIPNYRWQAVEEAPHYESHIARIRNWISAGDIYQVNHTMRLTAPLIEPAHALLARMVNANRPRYSAWLETSTHILCSASPELFFEWEGEHIASRPMKGTTGRGLWLEDDEVKAQRLLHSEKDRAENVMIVDMVRNDLGRIARTGSVRVDQLFELERYPTLWQLTSTVSARTSAGFTDILRALFPAASITGAPKARAMQIIADQERHPRGVYTGCIGYLDPGRKARFNVAIRTAVIDRASQQVEYGVGSGIVWDSRSAAEYKECVLKARIVTDAPPPFELLETLLWEPETGYFLLDEHMDRLRDSARYLDVDLDPAVVREALLAIIPPACNAPQRVRLLVDRKGSATVQVTALDPTSTQPVRLAIARDPIKIHNPFLYHKTTHRSMYETAKAAFPACDDVVLWNEAGEVTETTIANIVVEQAGRLLTPPRRCGLLAGVFRQSMLDSGQISEAVITVEGLRSAVRIFVVNSVRRWRIATLVE